MEWAQSRTSGWLPSASLQKGPHCISCCWHVTPLVCLFQLLPLSELMRDFSVISAFLANFCKLYFCLELSLNLHRDVLPSILCYLETMSILYGREKNSEVCPRSKDFQWCKSADRGPAFCVEGLEWTVLSLLKDLTMLLLYPFWINKQTYRIN